ncbi:hypothetical protein NIA69_05600 [Gemmiger formicilis]|nr:hypothetical protein [Gemmiger formicilis]
MSQAQLPYVLLYLCSTFLSAVSQVLLKKAALRSTSRSWRSTPTGG